MTDIRGKHDGGGGIQIRVLHVSIVSTRRSLENDQRRRAAVTREGTSMYKTTFSLRKTRPFLGVSVLEIGQ